MHVWMLLAKWDCGDFFAVFENGMVTSGGVCKQTRNCRFVSDSALCILLSSNWDTVYDLWCSSTSVSSGQWDILLGFVVVITNFGAGIGLTKFWAVYKIWPIFSSLQVLARSKIFGPGLALVASHDWTFWWPGFGLAGQIRGWRGSLLVAAHIYFLRHLIYSIYWPEDPCI